MRKTKIICTLGPASEKPETLRQLVHEGANVFRLNMSHAQHDWVREIVPRIRAIAEELGRSVAILMDTQGPAIRTGDLKTELHLKPGDILEFTVRGAKSEEAYSVDVNYDGLINDINEGDTVLVDNGVIHLLVLEKRENRIRCKVITPGTLGSRRHINLPGVRVNLPPLTQKDLGDVALGVEMNVDFVALSFVRQRSDLEELRELLTQKGSKAQVMAKIEDQSAVRLIHEIIAAADAIMVARGDLGIEMPNRGAADYSAKNCETLRAAGKAGDSRDPHAGIDDPQSPANPRGNYRCGQCGFRASRCHHVERRNQHRGLSGGMRAHFESSGVAYRAQRWRRLRQSSCAGRCATKNCRICRSCWQIRCRGRRSSFSPGTARWPAMSRICVRNTPPFLPSLPSEEVRRQLALCWGACPCG